VCEEKSREVIAPKSHIHTPGHEGAPLLGDGTAVIADIHVHTYSQSQTIDLYSVGEHEGKQKSVPFIQDVLLQTDGGEKVRMRAVVDDGAMANMLNVGTYEVTKAKLAELSWSSRVLRMVNGEGGCAAG
jgi:hypothetical protein